MEKNREMSTERFEPGDLVWALMPPFPWWPGVACYVPGKEHCIERRKSGDYLSVIFIEEVPTTEMVPLTAIRRFEPSQVAECEVGGRYYSRAPGWSRAAAIAQVLQDMPNVIRLESLDRRLDRAKEEAERKKNEKKPKRKKSSVDNSGGCVCAQKSFGLPKGSGAMIGCCLCRRFFHPKCIGLSAIPKNSLWRCRYCGNGAGEVVDELDATAAAIVARSPPPRKQSNPGKCEKRKLSAASNSSSELSFGGTSKKQKKSAAGEANFDDETPAKIRKISNGSASGRLTHRRKSDKPFKIPQNKRPQGSKQSSSKQTAYWPLTKLQQPPQLDPEEESVNGSLIVNISSTRNSCCGDTDTESSVSYHSSDDIGNALLGDIERDAAFAEAEHRRKALAASALLDFSQSARALGIPANQIAASFSQSPSVKKEAPEYFSQSPTGSLSHDLRHSPIRSEALGHFSQSASSFINHPSVARYPNAIRCTLTPEEISNGHTALTMPFSKFYRAQLLAQRKPLFQPYLTTPPLIDQSDRASSQMSQSDRSSPQINQSDRASLQVSPIDNQRKNRFPSADNPEFEATSSVEIPADFTIGHSGRPSVICSVPHSLLRGSSPPISVVKSEPLDIIMASSAY